MFFQIQPPLRDSTIKLVNIYITNLNSIDHGFRIFILVFKLYMLCILLRYYNHKLELLNI